MGTQDIQGYTVWLGYTWVNRIYRWYRVYSISSVNRIIPQLFLEPEWAIDSEAMRVRGIIVLEGRATHGKLTERAFPWVGILTYFKLCPWAPGLGIWHGRHLGRPRETGNEWPAILLIPRGQRRRNDLCFSSKHEHRINTTWAKERYGNLFYFSVYMYHHFLHC